MSTLAQTSTVVNPSDVSLVGWGSQADGDLLDKAHAWGHEDATEGVDMQGSVYFVGAALEAYNQGYRAGLYLRNALSGGELLGELEFMNGVLDSMRQGVTPAECTVADQWLYA